MMAGMNESSKPPRKPLRQRVAERRAGIPEEESQKSVLWRKRLTFFANVLQGAALLLLLIYVFEFMNRGMIGINYTVVIFYVIIFVIGRAIKIGLDIQKATRRRR